jgi:DNA segregation ATPase FtsK/SpoIIIE, S-DNA-T family
MAFHSADPAASSASPYAMPPYPLHGATSGSAAGLAGRSPRLLPDQIEDKLRGAFNRLAGAGLIALAIAAWASLLTWSIDDPTLTRAGAVPVSNMMGTSGAVLSDLLLRGIGLSAAFAMFPFLVWGCLLAIRQHVPYWRSKLVLWISGSLALAGAMASMPVVQAWNIPHGFGGLIGDLVYAASGGILAHLSAAHSATLATLLLLTGGAAALFASLGAGQDVLAMIWYGESWQQRIAPRAGGSRSQQAQDWSAARRSLAQPAVARGPSLREFASGFWRLRPGRPQSAVQTASVKPEPFTGQMPPGHAAPNGTHYGWPTSPPQTSGPQTSGPHMGPNLGPANDPYYHDPRYPHAQPGQPPAGYVQGSMPIPPPHHRLSTRGPVGHDPRFPDPRTHDPRFNAHRNARPDMDLDDQDGDAASGPAFEFESRAMAARFAPPHMAASLLAEEIPPASVRPVPVKAAPARPSAPASAVGAASPAKPARGLLAGWKGRAAKASATAEYRAPALTMLKRVAAAKPGPEYSQNVQRGVAKLLEDVLLDFGVKGQIQSVKPGPVVTLYELEPARGIKSSRIVGLSDDIARSMSATSARVAGVPGRNVIGIELPNMRRETVYLRELLESEAYKSAACTLPIVLGKGIGGEAVVADLARMPHVLVAGTTGSGKSVGINAMILSLLYKLGPDKCRFLMIDPKMLELSVYNGIPHLLAPVITDPHKALAALNWVVREMEERYKRMAQLSVRNIEVFNGRIKQAADQGEDLTRTVQTGFDPESGAPVYETERMQLEAMPYIVVIVDEMADLMLTAGKDIEGAVQRLAQMARAAGIHLIMATQRPSVDVITGTIKANFPTRVSFKVTSKIDSRTILGEQGAEQLLGAGDMLFSTGTGQITRVHGPFVADEEVEQIAAYLRTLGEPAYVEAIGEDTASDDDAAASDASESEDIYDKAMAVVLRDRKASTSYIQRRLSIGYNRAASIMERMEKEGLVSAANSVGKRNILVA